MDERDHDTTTHWASQWWSTVCRDLLGWRSDDELADLLRAPRGETWDQWRQRTARLIEYRKEDNK